MLSPYFVCSPCSPQGLEIDLCVPIFDPIFDPKLKIRYFPSQDMKITESAETLPKQI